MLKKLSVKNCTVFSKAELNFRSGLNAIIGENGSGKSHLLKVAYSLIAASAEAGRKPNAKEPTKTYFQKALANKLVRVLRPESLGRLARRKQGRERCEITMDFSDPELNTSFDFATSAKAEVRILCLPQVWESKAPVFLPTRELLTLYPGFVSVYDNHYLEFDETYRDTCMLLGAPALRGPRENLVAALLQPLEKAMGGKIVLDVKGRFYLKLPGAGTMEIPLVAEGLRKLAMIARLIATGSLLNQGVLFWDEPETNLNPKLIKAIAKVILNLCQNGIQVFITTHSLFLLRELELLSQNNDFIQVPKRYFALSPTVHGVTVEQGDDVEDLSTLLVLDEELQQSDRYIAAES